MEHKERIEAIYDSDTYPDIESTDNVWYIREQETKDLITALTLASEAPKLKFNSRCWSNVQHLLSQFKKSIKKGQ
jgi:hypothetical protein